MKKAIAGALEQFTIIVDTREQETFNYFERIDSMQSPIVRRKLDFGDYSAFTVLQSGEVFSLENRVTVERKMDFDELCSCYCRQRKRFTAEFERAKSVGAKTYLLVEHASWETAYTGYYRSNMKPKALIASLTTWLARYNCILVFCQPRTTGFLIKDILYREMKEMLEMSYSERLQAYEREKEELKSQGLNNKEYEKRVKELADKHGI